MQLRNLIITTLAAALLAAGNAHAVFWSYEGERHGQGDWGNLSPEFITCASGAGQSPVLIGLTKPSKLPALQFAYDQAKTTLSLDRYTVVSAPGGKLSVKEGKDAYILKEVLLRTPSEHDMGKVFYPLEVQLIHERSGKSPLIVSILVKEGSANPVLQSIIDHFPRNRGDQPTASIDWTQILPKTFGYYAYGGSLPYPPCTEGIEYRILKTPVEASNTQIGWLARKLGRNARNTQPLFLRTVKESE